jgi:hypothetical protein
MQDLFVVEGNDVVTGFKYLDGGEFGDEVSVPEGSYIVQELILGEYEDENGESGEVIHRIIEVDGELLAVPAAMFAYEGDLDDSTLQQDPE